MQLAEAESSCRSETAVADEDDEELESSLAKDEAVDVAS
jgi:hypothetical protein